LIVPSRRALASPRWLVFLFLALVSLGTCSAIREAAGATPAQVSEANGAIQAAYLSIYDASKSGGNVSSLVSQLNSAIQLVQTAETANATDPAKASSDLANATSMANGVAAAAGPAGQQGVQAKQLRLEASAGSVAVILAAAALVYAFGDRVYRKAWLGLYRNHVVRRVG
jgi:hypothetical protein